MASYPAVIKGGHHDGLEGDVDETCIAERFLVQEDGDYYYAYHLAGQDPEGRYIFVPPQQRDGN